MKKSTIITLTIILGLSFFSLLYLQFSYIHEIQEMRKYHFNECVNRSLSATVEKIEAEEMISSQNIPMINGVPSLPDTLQYEIDSMTKVMPNVHFYTHHNLPIRHSTVTNLPLNKRINFSHLDNILKAELMSNGIPDKYHYRIFLPNGVLLSKCPDYEAKGEDYSFKITLFPNEPISQTGTLIIHFPILEEISSHSYIFLLPSIFFTLIIFITFVVTVILVFRQRKLVEMKNDFINNMTHEFKTPISSISLAAQMLSDDTVNKTPQLTTRLCSTISDETKRLRFQVDKVLQLSLYDNQKVNYNLEDINVNDLIENVVNSFMVKVERLGGTIIADAHAESPLVYVDEMHLTNVIFNIMDNAVKYSEQTRPLQLKVSTWNENNQVCISIEDNGIGMRKDDLKKIFDRFYRVNTGNRHDVKGFGLGLAYVKKIITVFNGTVSAESDLGKGTCFVIHLPEVNFK